jgi:hypothetical protein
LLGKIWRRILIRRWLAMSKKLDSLIKSVETALREWRAGRILSPIPGSAIIRGRDLVCMHLLSDALDAYRRDIESK